MPAVFPPDPRPDLERPLPPLAPPPWDDREPDAPRPAPWTALVRTFLWGPFGLVLLVFVGGAAWLAWTWHAGRQTARPEPAPTPAPASALASLYVEADAPGALVWVDGDSLGAAPVWTYGLAPGAAYVRVRAGAAQVDTVVRVAAGSEGRVAVRLASPAPPTEIVAPGGRPADPEPEAAPVATAEPDPEADPPEPVGPPVAARRPPAPPPADASGRLGTLEVVAPSGAAIFVDGQLRVPRAGALYRTQLPPGPRRVRWVHPTLGLGEQTVVLGPSVTVRVTFDTPAEPLP